MFVRPSNAASGASQAVYRLVSNVTGHKIEDLDSEMYLEDDLGLDSIKMISLMNEMIGLVPAEQMDDFSAANPVTALLGLQTVGELVKIFEDWEAQRQRTGGQAADSASVQAQENAGPELAAAHVIAPVPGRREHLEAEVCRRISGITGHKAEDLHADMELEGDLGLDSIKMISLMSELASLLPGDSSDAHSGNTSMTPLLSMQTVGDIVEMLAAREEGSGAARPAAGDGNPVDVLIPENEPEFLEMLHTQYLFLITYLSVANLTITSGVRLRGELDAQSLQESWNELILRHPVLRAVFITEPENASLKGYRLQLLKDAAAPEIPVLDIRHLDEPAQRQWISGRFEASLNGKFDLTRWPLHTISVIHTADREYELILDINHMISDGLGNQQILREILEIYGAKSQNKTVKLRPALPAGEYNRVVSEMNAWNAPSEMEALDRYLQQQGRGAYFFNPYGPSRQADAAGSAGAVIHSRKYGISEETTARLIASTKSWRTSLFVLLVSAYLKTVKQQGEERDRIILNLPTSGKLYPCTDATGVLGAFAQNLALSFTCGDANEGWETLIDRTSEELGDKISSGMDRAQTCRAAQFAKDTIHLQNGVMPEAVASMIRSTLKSNLYLSYVGNTSIDRKYGNYEVYDYEAFTGTNPGTIDCLAELFQGRLVITANYDSSFFEDTYIEQHMGRLLDNLRQLAAMEPANAEALPEAAAAGPHAAELSERLRGIAQDISGAAIGEEGLFKDLEAELGMDSLQRIRLITKLGKVFENADRAGLFECRTLNEMIPHITHGNTWDNSGGQEPALEIPYLQISRQCKATPDAVAVWDGARKVTYRELDEQSSRLAHYLMSQGVRPQSLVGILTLPGPLMLTGILGILKAGAAYVPLDPMYPADRIEYIAGHARLSVLLTEQSLQRQADPIVRKSPSIRQVVYLNEGYEAHGHFGQAGTEEWQSCSAADPQADSAPHDLMVVLYTSGSTGKPKGVMLNHRGYMNRLEWHQQAFCLQPGERVAQKTSCCFDISVWELLWPLMYGGTVCPVRQEVVKNPWSLARWMTDNEINVMHFVPSLFGEFVNSLEDERYTFPALRWLIFSGEGLPLSPVQKWMDRYGMQTGLANLYGPTEASIDVTCHIISQRPGSAGEMSIPIGKPITGVHIKNLDEHMREVPEGEIGELWIGGIQLAKGYLHNPEKTREAFHPNPFPEIPGEFIYRTGDLTVKRADGSYEYHGRIDNQVKLRGFRVELGEIEAVLGSHAHVAEAAVIVIEPAPGQQLLLACLAGKQTADQELKEFAGRKLPYYMIPHRLEWLPRLPKNPNGKLDRKALGAMFGGTGQAAQVNQGAQATPAAQAAEAVQPAVSLAEPAPQGEDTLPLAPAQSWLMNYFDYPYCWAGYTRFLYKRPLNLQQFKKAAMQLNRRHDALRSVLVQKPAGFEQRFLAEETGCNVDFYDGSHLGEAQRNEEIQAILTEAIEGFRVDQWPLWRIIVVQVSAEVYDIAAVGHHLISDVITNQLLLQEIWQIYASLSPGAPEARLPEARPYADFVRAVQEQKRIHGKEYAGYWSAQFPPESVCRLPADFIKGPNDEQSAKLERFTFDREKTSLLLTRAKKHFDSNVYPLLLAPLYKLLGGFFRQPKVVVSHRVHGRDLGASRRFMQTPGNFAVNFPLGINVEENSGWPELIRSIRRELEAVPLGGTGYDLVSESLPQYMYPDTKLTPIRANYLGNRDAPRLPDMEFSREGLDRRFSLPGQKRISVIEFFFSIEEGRLTVEIEYSANLYAASTIQGLAEQYMEQALELLASVQDTALLPEAPREGLLANKVAVITGGSRGIGRSIALAMAREGADIVLVARSGERLRETADELRRLGVKALPIPADVSDAPSVHKAVGQIIERFGRIDILVNSAGITGMAAMADMSPGMWESIIQVNLLGTYHFCYAVIPYLAKQKQGKIINIGSDSSFIGYPMMSAYAASKHGVLGLTRALSEELKNSNIQVNAVCPSLVDTEMAPAAFKGRAIPPSGVADSVVFLASARADYITGEAVQVYGKQDMHWFGAQQMQLLQAVQRRQP
ncbi:non-ribosomal peptide synthetase [Paenibacillus sp. S150]|uniref:non-ribosomal peptide synthetase n=1 Tax=Paenibacillus sp. S150 TaxID=2749826 RepID=UPI001E53ED8E|nr:non-ribosomal peptide synthetase [Paenibacillus sp. S150]